MMALISFHGKRRVRRSPRGATLLIGLALAIAPADRGRAAGFEVTADATVDTTQIRPGEALDLTIRVEHPPGTTVEFPSPEGDGGTLFAPGFQLRGFAEPTRLEREDGGLSSARLYRLISYELDTTLVVPAIAVLVYSDADSSSDSEPSAAATEALTIQLRSSIPPEELAQAEAQPERPPVSIPLPFPWRKAITYLLLVALVGLLLWRWWRKRQLRDQLQDAPGSLAPLRPAHEVALEALDQLSRSELAQSGPAKDFYTELGDIVRAYLGTRYRFDALDHTSEELLRDLAEASAPARAIQILRNLMRECDLVKFAKLAPPWSEWAPGIDRARTVVHETMPPLPVTLTSEAEPPSEQEASGPVEEVLHG